MSLNFEFLRKLLKFGVVRATTDAVTGRITASAGENDDVMSDLIEAAYPDFPPDSLSDVEADYIKFIGADGATLGTINPEWAVVPGHTDTAYVYNNRLRSQAAVATLAAVYRMKVAPATADYEVGTTIYVVDQSTTPNAGVIARASSTLENLYLARWRAGTGFQLHKCIAGVYTQIGSTVAAAYANGSTFKLRLRVSGFTVSLYRDNESTPIISVQDTAIIDAGYPGLWTRCESTTVGPQLVDWWWEQSSALSPVQTNGIWTWFNDPRAVSSGGYTYIGSVSTDGTVRITQVDEDTGASRRCNLHRAYEVDDHDNPAIYIRKDGRIQCFYSKHGSDLSNGFNYRVSTNPHDITEWGAEQTVTGSLQLPTTYCNVFRLSSVDRVYNFMRNGRLPDTADFKFQLVSSADDGDTWNSATPQTIISNAAERPYIKWATNGVDRVDFLYTEGHPDETTAHVYHAYAIANTDGSFTMYKSDGTSAGSTISPASEGSLIYDATTHDGWVWDIAYGPDGNPWALLTKLVSATDHRLMFARWTGSEWTTPVEIAPGGQRLYLTQVSYSGGMCFDSADARRVYLATPVNNVLEIQEWRTSDYGATWKKFRDVTTNTEPNIVNARPYSPRNAVDEMRVLYWTGTYTTYNSYSTDIVAVAAGMETDIPNTAWDAREKVVLLGASAVKATLTGTVTKTALATVLIPAGTLKVGDILKVEPVWSITNSANNKVLTIDIGTTLGGAAILRTKTRAAGVLSESPLCMFGVRSMTSMSKPYDVNSVYAGSSAADCSGVVTVDDLSTVDVNLYISGTLANTGETIALEQYVVSLIRGPA